jgi:hypothetical protein
MTVTTTTLTSRRAEAAGIGRPMLLGAVLRSAEGAALLLCAWPVGALAAGVIALHRRDP